jgi:peptide/nickel transport system permease protein
MRRQRAPLFFGVLFVVIVLLCLLAPWYAHHVAGTGPNANHIDDTLDVRGKKVDVISDVGIPIGPTWTKHFFLGADQNGRDVAVRLLYGGRASLTVGFVATAVTVLLGSLLGLVGGYLRGVVDGFVGRLFDVIWAYPVLLLGIALGTTISLNGLNLGFTTLEGGSLLVPAFIIGIVYVPYLGRVVRTHALSLREREYVDAARMQGWTTPRILVRDVLPNVAPTVIVFIPLILAQAILLESSLSFLGAGVQPPNPSWGTMIGDGVRMLPGAIQLTLVPGAFIALTALSINVLGDGVRDALDPHRQLKVK